MRGRGLAVVPLPMPGWAPGAGRKAAFLATEVAAAEALAGQPGLSPGLRGMLDHGLRLSAERRDGIARTLEDTAAAFSAALDTVDVIATPTTPGLPVPRGTPPPADQADFTAPANIAGLPALSLPVGGAPRPVGLHLLGRPGAEEGLLDLAEQLAPYLT
jgi:aspartyl-tRNA(Asn)/glutamyl-tRNA(Gln) amidotransferase subunit A